MPVVLTGLTADLFYCICVYCGWSTALELYRASKALYLHWTSMSSQFVMAVQSTVVTVGCAYTEHADTANWDRLTLWTAFGSDKLISVQAPRPRFNSACVFDGARRIFILGGENKETEDVEESEAVGVAVDSFDLVVGVWTLEADMLTSRSDFAASCMLNELIAIGGTNEYDDVLDSVDVCGLGAGSWQARTCLAEARYNFALANMGSDVFVIGGLTDIGDIVATIEVLSDQGRTIRTLTSVPEPVTGCMATVRGAKLILIGGQMGDRLSDSARVQEFDTTTLSWAELELLPLEMSNALHFRSESRIHVFGGNQSEGVANAIDDVEAILNERTGQWITRPSPWNVAFGAAVWLDFSSANCQYDVQRSTG